VVRDREPPSRKREKSNNIGRKEKGMPDTQNITLKRSRANGS